MLDLMALSRQLAEMSDSLGRQAGVHQARTSAAVALWESGTHRPDALAERVDQFFGLKERPWLLAQPVAGLATSPLPPVPAAHTVVATDGSQIAPSHHEIALCYLVNVGRIMYTYGTGEAPVQESRPQLHHSETDMRPVVGGRPQPLNEDILATLRNLEESRGLVALAGLAAERGHPALALVDGTLIQWMLEGESAEFQEDILAQHLDNLEALRVMGVPVAGYLSNSRSSDVVNLLKLVACPFERLACESCHRQAPPCEAAHVPLSDRRLWERVLHPGERSPLFKSSSRILAQYRAHHIHFFYLHVGTEIARLEVPAWVATDPALLDRVHALAFDQAQKGMGYPITLQEAHNQAVVTREDRARFFSLLSGQLAASGQPVSVSHKQLKKRMGVV